MFGTLESFLIVTTVLSGISLGLLALDLLTDMFYRL